MIKVTDISGPYLQIESKLFLCHDSTNCTYSRIPTPAFSTALAFYDGYRAEKLPANLIQVSITY